MDSPKNSSAATKPFPAGDIMEKKILFQFAIYYLPEPADDPRNELDRLLMDKFTDFRKVEKLSNETEEMAVAVRMIDNVKETFAPPSLDALQHFGRGLPPEQATTVQDSKVAMLMDFSYSKKHVWDGMRSALELTSEIAEATHGLIWDEETRQLFSVDEWNKTRLRNWKEGVPDISKHITLHAYKKDEYVRAITLGMAKFGLPDIVVENFSWSISRNIGHIIILFAQMIAEGEFLKESGEFDLKLEMIKNASVREPQMKSLISHATGKALLSLAEGVWEEGDPKNRLIVINFNRYSGPDIQAKQAKMLEDFFGWEDKLAHVQHDEALKAASRNARADLPALQTAFNAGLAPGEIIQVKAPFDTPDGGREWMWVEVIAWNGDKIKGKLANKPSYIPTLHTGQNVEVSEAKVFDYIHKYPDGRVEGNETGKLIEKQSN